MKSIGFNYLSLFFGFGLFLISLFYLPDSLIAYEIPKVKLLYFLVFGLLLFVIWKVWNKRNVKELGYEEKIVMFWFGLLVVISYFGVDFLRSLFGNYYRWDGLVTNLVFVTMFLCLRILDKSLWFDGMVWGLAVGSLFSALIAVGQYFFGVSIGFDGMGAGFGQPVFLAGYLVVSLPFLWLFVLRLKLKTWSRCFLLVVFMTIVLMGLLVTKSLAGVALFFAFGFGLLLLYKKINWMHMTLIFLTLCVGVFAKYSLEIKRGEAIGSGLVYEGRQRLLMKSYKAFIKKPVFGWGIANFDKAFDSVDWPIKINNDIYADKAHSNIVEISVGSGLVGLIGYVYLIFVFVRKLTRQSDINSRFLLLALGLYTIHSQTNVTSVAEEMIFWFILAAS